MSKKYLNTTHCNPAPSIPKESLESKELALAPEPTPTSRSLPFKERLEDKYPQIKTSMEIKYKIATINDTLQAYFPHLEVNVKDFDKLDYRFLILGAEFNGKIKEQSLNKIASNKFVKDYFDLISTNISLNNEMSYIYDLTHSITHFMDDVEPTSENLGSVKKLALPDDFVISRLRSYLTEMAVIQQKPYRQLLSSEYLVFRPKSNEISSNTLMVFALTSYVQNILNNSQYGTEHPRFYDFVFNELPIPDCVFLLNESVDEIMKDSYELLESSKELYKKAQNLLHSELGLDSNNMDSSLVSLAQNDGVNSRHVETSFVMLSGAKHLDPSLNAQGDEVRTQGDEYVRHVESVFCHVEPQGETSSEKNLDSNNRPFASPQGDEYANSLESKFSHLNITICDLKNSLLKTGRLDSEYYQQKYTHNENLIKSYKGGYCTLGECVEILKSIEPGSNNYQAEGIPFMRISNLSEQEISKSDIFLDKAKFADVRRPKKGQILFSKDGSVGIAYHLREDADFITSGAILHLSVKDYFLP